MLRIAIYFPFYFNLVNWWPISTYNYISLTGTYFIRNSYAISHKKDGSNTILSFLVWYNFRTEGKRWSECDWLSNEVNIFLKMTKGKKSKSLLFSAGTWHGIQLTSSRLTGHILSVIFSLLKTQFPHKILREHLNI